MPKDLAHDQSTLVQIMAWCRQATSHYPNQCWPSRMAPYGIIRSQWVGKMAITRTTRTHAFWEYPRRPMITHTMDSYQIPCHNKTKSKLQILKKCQKFWSCLIRCANMKWIRLILWKIQSGHDFVHRRRDGQTDGNDVKPVYPTFNLVEAGV